MSEVEGLPKGFESPYLSFLWKELGIIRELEREGAYYQALDYSVSLVKYLHPAVQEEVGNEGKKIMDTVNYNVSRSVGVDRFTTWNAQNREAKRLGRAYLDKFVTLLSNQLSERLYMERLRRKVPEGGET